MLETKQERPQGHRDLSSVVRPVLPVTTALRDRYAKVFEEWLTENGIDFSIMLCHHIECIDETNLVLVNYGKALYEAGRPYNHYLETINLVVAKKPLLRRMLQTAWDYAFSWVKQEPSAHHVAMPFQVLMACISVAIAWGWDRVAGSLALMWGALLRAGEFLAAPLPAPVTNRRSQFSGIRVALNTRAQDKTDSSKAPGGEARHSGLASSDSDGVQRPPSERKSMA